MDAIKNDLLFNMLMDLEPERRLAIHLRFWEQFTIAQVAIVIGLTWDEADRLIETTLNELKTKLTTLTGTARSAA